MEPSHRGTSGGAAAKDGHDGHGDGHRVRQERGRRKVLEKSKSMIDRDRFDLTILELSK